MSALTIVQPLIAAALLAAAASSLHRRLPPRAAAHFITWLIGLVGLVALPTLALLTLNLLAHFPLVGPGARWCAETVGVHAHTAPWLGAVSMALLAAGSLRAACLLRERRQLACAHEGPVDVVGDEAAFAFTLPGRGGRVVVSSGLLEMLSATETEIVLCHERAHARLRHDRFLLAVELATAAFLPLGLLARRARYSLERWADEVAAVQFGDRRLVARTIGKVALATTQPAGVAGFAGNGVAGRVQALLAPPSAAPRAPALAAVGAASLALATLAAIQLHHLGPLIASLCHH